MLLKKWFLFLIDIVNGSKSMHYWFCPFCLFHLIRRKFLHFEKPRLTSFVLKITNIVVYNKHLSSQDIASCPLGLSNLCPTFARSFCLIKYAPSYSLWDWQIMAQGGGASAKRRTMVSLQQDSIDPVRLALRLRGSHKLIRIADVNFINSHSSSDLLDLTFMISHLF